jgi:hypothetical protein
MIRADYDLLLDKDGGRGPDIVDRIVWFVQKPLMRNLLFRFCHSKGGDNISLKPSSVSLMKCGYRVAQVRFFHGSFTIPEAKALMPRISE